MRIPAGRVAQSIFGLVLIVFCLMPLFGWESPPVRGEAQQMQEAIASSGYIIPVILFLYLAVGLSWLLDEFVALSAVVLFPVSLNIALFHTVLNKTPFGLIAAYFLLIVNLYMLYRRRESYARLLERDG